MEKKARKVKPFFAYMIFRDGKPVTMWVYDYKEDADAGFLEDGYVCRVIIQEQVKK